MNMTDVCDVLEQLYKQVLLGATLENDKQDYAVSLNPAFSDHDGRPAAFSECSCALGVHDEHLPSSVHLATVSAAPVCLKSHSQRSRAREAKLLQLTVMKVMVARILAAETECRAKEEYREIINILLKSSDIDSTLTYMFRNPDKLLAHMASNCLALLLYFQLKEKITLRQSWIAFCQKNLSEYSERDEVVYCLCTLTVVMKEIFKDTCSQKTEILRQFLTPLDTVLEDFYNSLFSQHLENHQDPSKAVHSLMGSLELLELLTASRIHLGLHCPCQRIFFLTSARVLDVITWPIQAFVKRKSILFVKKSLLWKVGEDLCRGSPPPFMPGDRHLEADMLVLADAVLRAVDQGLLRTLSVRGKPSCFGGGELQLGCEQVPASDHVILRASSLLVIKSLEIKFQNCASADEMQVDLQRFMAELLTFLKPHLQPSLWSHHPCEWLSRVFIEQDDDILEAARASMGIYLRLARKREVTANLTQEKEIWDHHTHENGYNPHCIFLFFLKSVGFDSTVLLDFLISSETCFLEYFVRYLKLLEKDWDEFFTICKCLDVTKSSDSINVCGWVSSLVQGIELRPLAALGSHRKARAAVPWASDTSPKPSKQTVMSKEPQATLPTSHLRPPQASQSLVNYDSSDDSEVESRDLCVANGKRTSSYQEAMKKIRDTVGTSGDNTERSLELLSGSLVSEEWNTPLSMDCDAAPESIASEVGISDRTVKCFEELQGAVYRLQKKNLFPYNPAALLKLLKRIVAICNKSVNPL